MKILLHDYAGHAFPVQLSRALAARGHEVIHTFASALQNPQGELLPQPQDAPTLRLESVAMDPDYAKHRYASFVRRRRLEMAYGRRAAALVRAERPDVVLSGQAPTEVQETILKAARAVGARSFPWVQDIYSLAVDRLARKKFPVIGAAAGAYYKWLEKKQWRQSEKLVAITEDFTPIMVQEFGVPEEKIVVIPNWAPLESVPVRPKRNAWSEAHGLADKFVYLYSGTLGLKHNPALLLELARRYRHDDAVRVVVVSEGLGADWLRAQTAADPLPHLIQMDFQPFATLPDMLGTGDVLIGMLEEAAAVFSVPSKVLSYLCAERSILLAAPAVNLATRTVSRQRAGITCEPADTAAFLEAADRLYRDPALRSALGGEGRAYAERTFRIEEIVDRFEALLGVAGGGRKGRPPSPSAARKEEAAGQGLLRVSMG